MKKIVISIVAALAGMGLALAQNLNFKLEAYEKAINENDTIIATGVVDNEDVFSIKLYLVLTNTSATETLNFQPAFDMSKMPEGSMLAFCAGDCYTIDRIPVISVDPEGVLGANNGMDLEYTPGEKFDTVIIGCTFTNVDSNSSLKFYVKFIPTKPGRPDVANENRELAGVSVYPNPADGLFNLNVPARAQVEIFSANGQVVRQMEVGAGQTSLQLNNAGIYFIRVRANGKQAVKRLVVR